MGFLGRPRRSTPDEQTKLYRTNAAALGVQA